MAQCEPRQRRNPRIRGLRYVIRGLRYVHCGVARERERERETPEYIRNAILEFEDCGGAVYTVSTQSSNPMHRASHKYGTIGALLCDPQKSVRFFSHHFLRYSCLILSLKRDPGLPIFESPQSNSVICYIHSIQFISKMFYFNHS